jgi:hypothetical protein
VAETVGIGVVDVLLVEPFCMMPRNPWTNSAASISRKSRTIIPMATRVLHHGRFEIGSCIGEYGIPIVYDSSTKLHNTVSLSIRPSPKRGGWRAW